MSRPAAVDVRVATVQLMHCLLGGGGSLTRLLPAALERVAPADRALLQSLCFDLARFQPRLEALLVPLLDKPLRRKDHDVHVLLLLGLLQLTERRMPAHAAVDTTVAVARQLGKPWARGLVNAVLRNFQRRQTSLADGLNAAEALAHPAWLLERLQQDWPEHWQRIAEANNVQAPMALRINTRQFTVARWLTVAKAAGVEAHAVAHAPVAAMLAQPQPVEVLPGFGTGGVSVQDTAAQQAGSILQAWFERPACAEAGGRVAERRLLDACAAPGGKTAHALELQCEAGDLFTEVVALDHDAERLERVQETLVRLQLTARATLLARDAALVESWWNGQPFDAVLLDAPCSGTGVIRRHPDIRLLRRADDIDALAQQQWRLLEALWPLVVPGGCLLYATCSVLKGENEALIQRFAGHHDDVVLHDPATLAPLGISAVPATRGPDTGVHWGRARPGGRQILPGELAMDGFFYALLVKR